MPKLLARTAALLLVPCLIADPTLGAWVTRGLSTQPYHSVQPQALFTEQAVNAALANFFGDMPNKSVKVAECKVGAKLTRQLSSRMAGDAYHHIRLGPWDLEIGWERIPLLGSEWALANGGSVEEGVSLRVPHIHLMRRHTNPHRERPGRRRAQSTARGQSVEPKATPPEGFSIYPGRMFIAGPRVTVAEGHLTVPQGQYQNREVVLEGVAPAVLAQRILAGISSSHADSVEVLQALRPLVGYIANRWWAWGDSPERKLQDHFKVLDKELKRAIPLEQREKIIGEIVRGLQNLPGDTLEKRAAELLQRASQNLASLVRIYGNDVGDWSNTRIEFVMNAGTPMAFNEVTRVLQVDLFTLMTEKGDLRVAALERAINGMKIVRVPRNGLPDSRLVDEVVLVLLDLREYTYGHVTVRRDERFNRAMREFNDQGAKAYAHLLKNLAPTSDISQQVALIVQAMREDPAWAHRTGLPLNIDIFELASQAEHLLGAFRSRWRYGERVLLDPNNPEVIPIVAVSAPPASVEVPPPAATHSWFLPKLWIAGSVIIAALVTLLYVDWKPLQRIIELLPSPTAQNQPSPSVARPSMPSAPMPSEPSSPRASSPAQPATGGQRGLGPNEYRPGGANTYEPAPASETTYDRVNNVMGMFYGVNVIGHQAASGEPDVHVGPPSQAPAVSSLRRVVQIRLGGYSVGEMLMMDFANVLEEGGVFSQAGAIDFIPSDKLANERTNVMLYLPPMRRGYAMRLPIILNGRVDPRSISDLRFWVNAQGWLTARVDIEDRTPVTFDWIKTSENGSFRAGFPVTPWMRREFGDIPPEVRRDLDSGQGKADRTRASVLAGVVRKYLGYNAQQRVQLRQETWMQFLGQVLQTEDRFVSDCDVLLTMAFIFARYLDLDAIMVAGFNNRSGHSLIGRERAHATLVIRIGNRWLQYDPSSEAPFVSLEKPATGKRDPLTELFTSMRPPAPAMPKPEPGIEPASLRGSSLQVSDFIPDPNYFPPRQSEEERAAKAERRRKLMVETPAETPGATAKKRPSTYRVQPGQSFDDVARAVFTEESYYYPDALYLIADNINYTIDGDVDRLMADTDLIVRPHQEFWEKRDPIWWERNLYKKYGRAWYERRHRLLEQALLRESQRPSPYTPEIQAELRRRAGARWPFIEGDVRAKHEILIQIEQARGVKFERKDLEGVLIETLALSERVLRESRPLVGSKAVTTQQAGVNMVLTAARLVGDQLGAGGRVLTVTRIQQTTLFGRPFVTTIEFQAIDGRKFRVGVDDDGSSLYYYAGRKFRRVGPTFELLPEEKASATKERQAVTVPEPQAIPELTIVTELGAQLDPEQAQNLNQWVRRANERLPSNKFIYTIHVRDRLSPLSGGQPFFADNILTLDYTWVAVLAHDPEATSGSSAKILSLILGEPLTPDNAHAPAAPAAPQNSWTELKLAGKDLLLVRQGRLPTDGLRMVYLMLEWVRSRQGPRSGAQGSRQAPRETHRPQPPETLLRAA